MAAGTFLCEHCGEQMVNPPGTRGRKPRWCSPQCRHAATYEPVARSEEELADQRRRRSAATKSWWASIDESDRSAMGSRAAHARWEGHEVAPRSRREERECRFCGTSVLMTKVQQSCGAPECRLARNAERMREHYARKGRDRADELAKMRAKGYTDEKRTRDARRRALKQGASTEEFSSFEVFDRDEWMCGICGDSISLAAQWPHPMSVSLDHIVPLSLGGDHSRENTRCAHLGCNVRRGNRTDVA